jgi:putative membrane protein
VAIAVLDDMTTDPTSFVIAVGIFTVVAFVTQPLMTSLAIKHVNALAGATALVTTFVSLVVTTLVTDGLAISGLTTWIAATVIVWLAELVAALLLPVIFVKNRVGNRESEPGRGAR